MFGFRNLIVYQKAKEFVILVYRLTSLWPKEELYGLVSQMRRAAVSIAANIAEGYTRSGTKEFSRFLDIALGSLVECEVFLEIAHELGYGQTADIEKAKNLLIEIKKLLYSFKGGLNDRVKENRVKE
jgi:four helix bundle protein